VKKHTLQLCLALTLAACGSTTTVTDAGTDAGETGPVIFNVSGTAKMHPEGLGLLADAGLATSLEGLTLRVEEPFKVALNDPAGIFGTQVLTAAGTFAASQISSEDVNLGVGVGIRDDSDAGTPRVVRSATIIYDVALNDGAKPQADITGAVGYAVPTVLHDALTKVVTPATIGQLTQANPQTTLVGAGFILGQVLDASGAPLAGVTITPSVGSKSARLFYPSADLQTLGTATSSRGVFLYVHTGGDVDTFRFNVTGHTEYKTRNAGAAAGAALVVTLTPGP
jgi:hypothetical protein